MPLDIQTRLLRVLADGQFYRVGGHSPIRVDVRIVAATHQNLEKLVHEGDFREDLFHRLNVIRVQIPALRERKQDIENSPNTSSFERLMNSVLKPKPCIHLRWKFLIALIGRVTFANWKTSVAG